jgi:endonuclease YncB( thermonuclease family)
MMRLRLSRRDRKLFAWGAGGAVLAGALLGALVVVDRKPPAPAARPDRVPPPAAPSTAARTTVGTPSPDAKVQERPLAPPEHVPLQPVELDPPFLILDGLTFSAGLSTYRLDGLKGPPSTAACRNSDGHLWACGLQARAALNNVIQRKRLVCTPVRTGQNGVAEATCTADGADVGGQLAAQGWARPVGDASGAYRAEAHEAEQDKRGLWNGGWTFSGPG